MTTDGRLHMRMQLTQAGLGRVANQLVTLSMPSIRMYCQRAAELTQLPPGSSRLGGEPDLPPSKVWPNWQGHPMEFIGQVNLADVAAHDEEGSLPPSGLLSFFCTIDANADRLLRAPHDPSSWMVSRFDGEMAALIRHPRPPELPEGLHFPACAARFAPELSPPDHQSLEVLRLLSVLEWEAYSEFLMGDDGRYLPLLVHRLLGRARTFERSPLVAGYLKAHGIADPLPSEEAAVVVLDPRDLVRTMQDLQNNAEAEWRLLFQVSSSTKGILHFCIPKAALSQGRFDRVWAEMQFL
jgi:hypothetical protein